MRLVVVILVAVLASSSAFAKKPAWVGSRDQAVAALKKAKKQIDSVPQCAQTQGGNIKDAIARAAALSNKHTGQQVEDLRLYISGIALGGAFSSCTNEMQNQLGVAVEQLRLVSLSIGTGAAPAPAAATTTYASDLGDEDEDEEEESSDAVVAEDVVVDGNFIDRNGERAVLFSAENVQASGLRGKKIKWQLLVKRKSAPWKKAKVYDVGETKIAANNAAVGDVAISVRYRTFSRDGFGAGDHVAALRGATDKGRNEVFRDELPFVIPANGGAASFDASCGGAGWTDNSYAPPPPPPAPGPEAYAMSAQAFAGFVGAVQSTSSDLSKVDLIKNAAKKNKFTAAQLGALLDPFSSDLSRLDAAKAVIPKLVDPENAYGLASKFTSSLNRAEFTEELSR